MNTTHMRFPSNRVRDIERFFHTDLHDCYPDGEIGMFVGILFEEYLGWDKAHFLLNRDATINQSDLLKMHWALEDLKHFRPIQHIIGHTEFCGLRIDVSPDVLIPRPETEEIVSQVVELISHQPQTASPLKIIDLCTGSGCIAIALKHLLPQSQVSAIDLSHPALEMARKNATSNHTKIEFLPVDVLSEKSMDSLSGSFDLIISNPPYVRQSERVQMSANVTEYEPSCALFVPDEDPLVFYRHIGHWTIHHLAPNGILALEINEYLSHQTCHLLNTIGFTSRLLQDFRGKDRCIIAQHNIITPLS